MGVIKKIAGAIRAAALRIRALAQVRNYSRKRGGGIAGAVLLAAAIPVAASCDRFNREEPEAPAASLYETVRDAYLGNLHITDITSTGTTPEVHTIKLSDGSSVTLRTNVTYENGDPYCTGVTVDDISAAVNFSTGDTFPFPIGTSIRIEVTSGGGNAITAGGKLELHCRCVDAFRNPDIGVTTEGPVTATTREEPDGTLTALLSAPEDLSSATSVTFTAGNGHDTATVTVDVPAAYIEGDGTATICSDAGVHTLPLNTNTILECTADDDWLTVSQDPDGTIRCTAMENPGQDRETRIILATPDGRLTFTVKVIQLMNPDKRRSMEKDILMELYTATGGDGWYDNTGWNSEGRVNTWHGIRTDADGYVTHIDLTGNNLTGQLPESLFLLKDLEKLMLGNNNLDTDIPKTCALADSLQYLFLGNADATYSPGGKEGETHSGRNRVHALIPELGDMESLIYLTANNTQLGGTIPDELWSAPRLENLFCGMNNLTGPLSEAVGNARELRTLSLSCNLLDGEIPQALFTLEKLEGLDLGNSTSHLGEPITTCNHITGEIPPTISRMKSLKSIYLASLGLSGPIPAELFLLPNIEQISLANCYNHMNYINTFSGEIPDIPENGTITLLELPTCGMTGEIPQSMTNLKNLEYLTLSGRDLGNGTEGRLAGEIPEGLASMKLKYLDLAENDLTGNIPEEFGETETLRTLFLKGNRLSGRIPEKVTSCSMWEEWLPQINILPQQKGYTLTIN